MGLLIKSLFYWIMTGNVIGALGMYLIYDDPIRGIFWLLFAILLLMSMEQIKE